MPSILKRLIDLLEARGGVRSDAQRRAIFARLRGKAGVQPATSASAVATVSSPGKRSIKNWNKSSIRAKLLKKLPILEPMKSRHDAAQNDAYHKSVDSRLKWEKVFSRARDRFLRGK